MYGQAWSFTAQMPARGLSPVVRDEAKWDVAGGRQLARQLLPEQPAHCGKRGEQRVAGAVILVDGCVGSYLPRLPRGLQIAKWRRRGSTVTDRKKSDRRKIVRCLFLSCAVRDSCHRKLHI